MPSCSRKNRSARLALYCTIGCLAIAALGSDRPAQAAEPSTGTARTAPAGINRLLIVAPEKFQPALEKYVAFKKRFLPTEFATLEDVLDGSPGVDDPEKLKHFIYDAWRNRTVSYVLLVGDRQRACRAWLGNFLGRAAGWQPCRPGDHDAQHPAVDQRRPAARDLFGRL
jgi:hypothetical protein